MRRRNLFAWLGVLMVLTILTWIALGHTGPEEITSSEVRVRPFAEYERMLRCYLDNCPNAQIAKWFLVINGLGNILVFVPLGVALYIALGGLHDSILRIVTATAIALLVSTAYEIAQIWIPGRVVATDDVILNSMGAAIGAWGVSLFPLREKNVNLATVLEEDDGQAT